MHGKDLFINDGRNWQAVEAVGKRLPQFDVVPPLALIVEAINAINARALVIPTKDEKVLWILDLVRQQQANGLKRLLASINVISQKQIIRFGRETAVFKKTEEIVVLSVNVTANLSL
jgi:hypothetical protein